MAYIKTFLILCLSILIKLAYSESNCGTSLCLSTNVIKPGEPVHLSWHKSDNPNGLQISLLYGDNSDKTDCHELQGQHVLKSWKLNHGEEEYDITINDVDFDIEDKTFVFLVEYLTSNFCMMAPAGPKGLGTSYVVIDKSMPVKKPEVTKSSSASASTNASTSSTNSSDNSNNNSDSSKTSSNDDSNKSSTNTNEEDKSNGSSNNDSNNDNNNDSNNANKTDTTNDNTNDSNNSNEADVKNGNNNTNKPINGDKDNDKNVDDDDDGGFFNTFNTILFIVIGIILLILACCLLAYCFKRMKGKDKNSNADSLKQNSTTRMLSPTLTDDAFAEDSVYSAVNINEAIPPPPQNPNENYVPNVSVESFNSSTSQSGLISRHEAKMIAERFRCELQNPLNNEVDDASSIKDKKEESV